MSRRFTLLSLASLALTFAGCSKQAGKPGTCDRAADCKAGEVCWNGKCATVCVVQRDCPTGQICSTDGICVTPQGGTLPQIELVSGNEPGDPTRVRNGLLVSGSYLDGAVFELAQGSTAWPLGVVSQTDLLAELTLPADVRSGAYILVVTNQAGSDQASVTLTLPELDGNTILTRLNGASGTIAFARLPVGITAGTLAEGNHNHDDLYALRAEPGAAASDGNLVPNGGFTVGDDFLDFWAVVLEGTGTTATVENVTGGVGAKAFQNGPLTRAELTSEARLAVDPNRVYRLRGRFREVSSGGAGGVYLGVRAWDQGGSELGGGTWPVYAASAVTPGSSWVHFATAFGAGTTRPLPVDTATMSLAVVLNADLVNSTIPGNRQFQVQDLGIFGYTAPPTPIRTSAAVTINLTSDQAGLVALSPSADATVTLPLADAYSGLGFELVNRSAYTITVNTGTGELVSKFGSYGYLHVVAIADPPDNSVEWAVRSRYSTVTETFTTNSSWTVPNGVVEVTALLAGGGGGGGGGRDNNTGAGGGGGGGGGVLETVIPVVPGTIWTITIGSAGSGGLIEGSGTPGGSTQMTGPGGTPALIGLGGSRGNRTTGLDGAAGGAGGGGCGGAGEAGSSYDSDNDGTYNYFGGAGGATNGGGGGGSYYGAGGDGATCRAAGGAGGATNGASGGGGGGGGSLGAGGAGGRRGYTAAMPGTAPGGGGGGGGANQVGAAGAAGVVIIRY